jgi:hypothetical protein
LQSEGLFVRQLVPFITAVAALCLCWGCGAIAERPDAPAELRENGAHARGDGDGDRELDAGPHVPPPIESCFGAGTPIATPSGEQAIETLEVGDAVWAFDVERGERALGRVSALHRHEATSLGQLITPDGRALLVTPSHPVYVHERSGFVAARELEGGETLVQLDATDALLTASVSGFVADVAHAPVFNLTVEGAHTYFAGGILVHNKSPPPPPCPYPGQSPYDCRLPWEACFAPGTSIATPSGERPIEALRVGDEVWGFDLERRARVASRVSAVHRHEAREVGAVVLGGSRVLYATANHPFYDAASKRYVPAHELDADAKLLALEGDEHAVMLEGPAFVPAAIHSVVHNISVEGVHNYFAGGVLVHNKEAPLCPTYDWGTDTGCEHPVVGSAIECTLDSALLSRDAYVARLNALLFAVHDAGGTAAAPLQPSAFEEGTSGRALLSRNQTLESLFNGSAAFELGAFLAHWLRVPAPSAPSATGTLEEQLYWQLATDLGRLVSRPEGLTIAELLAYRESVLTAELAALYGVPDPGQAQLASLPERHGVLGEIAFLRAHPTPSARGRVLDELFQCHSWTAHEPAMFPPLQLTTRYDAYAQLETTVGCTECHELLDPIGLALELFDELGAFRPVDNGYDVVPHGAINAPVRVTVQGAQQLGSALSETTISEGCVAASLLEAALGRPSLPVDQCSVVWIMEGMQGRGDLRGALLSLLTSASLRHEAPL